MVRDKRQVEKEIAALQAELEGMSQLEAMSCRELARASGVSPTTALMAKRGEILDHATMVKLLPFMTKCPCCRQVMDAETIETAQASFARRKN